MSNFQEISKLRRHLFSRLKKSVKNDLLVEKQIRSFDYIISRRRFLGAAGKLTALAAIVNTGLAPSAWAAENCVYEVKDPALQLTDAEKEQMAQPATIAMSGVLMDDQLMLKTGGEITNFEGHHAVVYGAHHTPYIETEQGEDVRLPSPVQMELISLEQNGQVTHQHRTLESGHGFRTDIITQLPSGANPLNYRLFAYSHPDNGMVDDAGYTVGSMFTVLVDNHDNASIYYRTTRTLVTPGQKVDIIDSNWQSLNLNMAVMKFNHVLVGELPCVVLSDGHLNLRVMTFGNLRDVSAGRACINLSSAFPVATNIFPKGYVDSAHFNIKSVKLTRFVAESNQCTFSFFPSSNAAFHAVTFVSNDDPYSHDVIYSCQDLEGNPSLVMMSGNNNGNIVRVTTEYKGMVVYDDHMAIAINHTNNHNLDGTLHGYSTAHRYYDLVTNVLSTSSSVSGKVKSLHRQFNSYGICTVVAHLKDDAKSPTYKLRETCTRIDNSSITSPFVPEETAGKIGEFENYGYEDYVWYPDSADLIGVLLPPHSANEYDAITVQQVPNPAGGSEYIKSLVIQDKFTLSTHAEQLVVPMSLAEAQANEAAGKQQVTDTFYHSELSVLDINGYSVSAGVKVEVRSSRPCRLIDNYHGYAHSISREHPVVIETNAVGRVVVSTRATDMTAPTLYARIYDDGNTLSGDRILLSTKGAERAWSALNSDVDANKRMADKDHTNVQSLREANLIGSAVSDDQASGVADVIRGAGQKMASRSNTPPSTSNLVSSTNGHTVNPLNQISYIAGENTRQLTQSVYGSWTIDLMTGASRQLQAGEMQGVALGGIFHSIGHAFSHIVHSITHGVKTMINGVARTITKVTLEIGDQVSAAFHYIENGIEQAVKFVMDTVEHIAKALYAVLCKVAQFVGDVIKTIILYIKLLFNFSDIFALTKSLLGSVKQQIRDVASLSSHWAEKSSGLLKNIEQTLCADIDGLSGTQYSDTLLGTRGAPASQQVSVTGSNSCVQNYVTNKFCSSVTNMSGQNAMVSMGADLEVSSSEFDTTLTSLVSQVVDSGLVISEDMVQSLYDATMGGFDQKAFVKVLQDQKALIHSGCQLAESAITTLAQLAELSENLALSALDQEVPFLGWLLKLFGLDLTWGTMFAFLAALPLHTTYAVMTGKSLKSVDFTQNTSQKNTLLGGTQAKISEDCIAGYITMTQLSIALGCMDIKDEIGEGDNPEEAELKFATTKAFVKILKGMFDFGKAVDNYADETAVGYLSPSSSFMVALIGMALTRYQASSQAKLVLAMVYALIKWVIFVVMLAKQLFAEYFELCKAGCDGVGYTADAYYKTSKSPTAFLAATAFKECSLGFYIANAATA